MKFLGYEPVFLASWKEHTQSSVMADAMAALLWALMQFRGSEGGDACIVSTLFTHTGNYRHKKECLGHRWVMLETLDVFFQPATSCETLSDCNGKAMRRPELSTPIFRPHLKCATPNLLGGDTLREKVNYFLSAGCAGAC